ncbi:Bax inhibitor-1/YccA family protein [Catellatospora sp. NPDC049609]|uniref:Bax inhibitor-1/YccA family protein n=1 Tax=Catellatospora sp. NPDC049609 TaxID=3155505 RepID=UPI0034187878
MKSSNPVLGRISAAAQQPRYSVPGQGAPAGYPQADGQGYGYPEVVQTGHADRMTIDDVVVKTVTLLAITAVSAAITWALVPLEMVRTVWWAAAILGLVVGLVISFAQVTNVAVIAGYAVVEGVFLGAVSKAYEYLFEGIVLQAVIATLGVFLAMALLYKAKIIRATPKFMKVVIGIAAGLGIVMLVNVVLYFVTGSVGPLRDGGPIAIGFSLVCIVVAALMFVVNFKQIEDGVAAGLPRKYGWLGAFGMLVELVWMYLEFLRLLSYLQGDD